MAIFDYAQPSPIAGAFGATIRGVYPSNLDMMLRSMGYGQTAMTSGGSFGGSTNAGSQQGPNAGQQNDTMMGGPIGTMSETAFGTDFMGNQTGLGTTTGVNFNGTPAPTANPSFNDQAFNETQANAAAAAAQAQAGGVPSPPGLGPSTNPSSVGTSATNGWGATVTNVAGVPVGQPAATTPAKSNPTAPMGLPAATVMNAPTQAVNNPSVGLNAGVDYGGQSDPQGPAGAGNPGAATSPDQDPTGGIGAGSTAPGGSAATGMATGQDSGQHGSFGGGTAFGGGSGDGSGGNGSPGANGVGNSNDAGSGTPGAGQSGEGGQWRVGTAHTGDDGDMDRDEPVKGQVHENEAVLPRELRDLIGQDTLSHMIRVSRSKLSDNQKKALIRALWS